MIIGKSRDDKAKLDAISRSQALIEFNLEGEILYANEIFCNALGYSLVEIKGKNHSLFVTSEYRNSREYSEFWTALARGKHQTDEFMRIRKDGSEIWIQATYIPILNRANQPVKIIKIASDISEAKLRNAEFEGQIEAINKSQAVIHFELDGTIIKANQNFCMALGYSPEEIQGKHHRMFVESSERENDEYHMFWNQLREGKFQSGEFRRIAKGGREIWIQATYNPIVDANGQPFKVVKIASDITEQVLERQQRETVQIGIDKDLNDIASAVHNLTQQADNAVDASAQTSSNVQAVASAAEELVASIGEINQQVAQSTRISSEAVNEANQSGTIVSSLSDQAQSIGEIVELIENIASQTNLLALNATIEAARAGDAGKGFAVVASEVKGLASQTTKATEDISARIQSVQDSSSSAVTAIDAIKNIISQVSEYSESIAAAVEEQSSVTREIATNMQIASDGVGTVSENLQLISDSTNLIESSTSKVREASREIA